MLIKIQILKKKWTLQDFVMVLHKVSKNNKLLNV